MDSYILTFYVDTRDQMLCKGADFIIPEEWVMKRYRSWLLWNVLVHAALRSQKVGGKYFVIESTLSVK
jgi:hypothetical protein